MSDVNIIYNNATVKSLDDSGAVVLKTAGKYCSGNVRIEYTKSSSGGGPPEYAKLPDAYKELEYVTCGESHPKVPSQIIAVKGDYVRAVFRGEGLLCGKYSSDIDGRWNINIVGNNYLTLYRCSKVFSSWDDDATKSPPNNWCSLEVLVDVGLSSGDQHIVYGAWDESLEPSNHFVGDLGILQVLRPTAQGSDYSNMYVTLETIGMLVPCYRVSDGVAGFYDPIHETFTQPGVGETFTRGPEKQED